jgi:hypothetical protein
MKYLITTLISLFIALILSVTHPEKSYDVIISFFGLGIPILCYFAGIIALYSHGNDG